MVGITTDHVSPLPVYPLIEVFSLAMQSACIQLGCTLLLFADRSFTRGSPAKRVLAVPRPVLVLGPGKIFPLLVYGWR